MAAAFSSSVWRRPHARIAAAQAGVEGAVALGGRHPGFEIGAIEDQRRARRKQPRGAREQAQRRLPRADMHHVDAEDRGGACRAGQRADAASSATGGAIFARPASARYAAIEVSPAGSESLGCQIETAERPRRSGRRARPIRSRPPAPFRWPATSRRGPPLWRRGCATSLGRDVCPPRHRRPASTDCGVTFSPARGRGVRARSASASSPTGPTISVRNRKGIARCGRNPCCRHRARSTGR